MSSEKIIHRQADIVFQNGVVYTVDQQRSLAEAVAVKGKDIIFVGSNSDTAEFIGPQTEVIDLGGKMLLPGFIDSHAHASQSINEDDSVIMYHLETAEDYLAAVKKFSDKNPHLSVIYGHGWNNEVFPPEGPLKEALDAVVSDRPVSLSSNDGHSIWVNSNALDMADITKDTLSPPGGLIEMNPATGEPRAPFAKTPAT